MWYLIASAFAKDISIRPNGTNDALYNAIKEASSGDRIILQEGTYKECVHTNGKDLIFHGENGAKLIGNGSCAQVVTVEGGQLDISSITFAHKNKGCILVQGRHSTVRVQDVSVSDCGGSTSNGGAVSVVGGSFQATDSRFARNKASKGAAIYSKGGAVTLSNVIISENMAQIGGGLFLEDSEVRITGSRILGNKTKTGGFGGGLAIREGSLIRISDTYLQNNHAQGKGGALYIDNSAQASPNRVELNTVEISANSASFGSSAGGGLYARNALQLSISNSTFSENLAAVNGGAIFLYDIDQDVIISNTIFEKNRARGGAGGAIVTAASQVDTASVLRVSHCDFLGNRAGGYGGAISSGNTYNLVGSLEVTDSVFEKNFADSSRSGAGGAIYFVSSEPFTFRVERSRFISNRAELTGGAIYAYQPQMMWVEDSIFFHNEARGPSTVGPRFGGALMVDSARVLSVETSKFCHNTASSSGTERISGVGGGIYVQKTDRIDLFNNQLWENEAQQWGGGIAIDTVQQSSIVNNSLVGNRAGSGGALYTKDTSLQVLNSIFAYTQTGVAALTEGGDWRNNNWYNNAAGHSAGIMAPNPAMQDVEIKPNFSSITIDGRCDDQLSLQPTSPLQSLGIQSDTSLSKIGAD